MKKNPISTILVLFLLAISYLLLTITASAQKPGDTIEKGGLKIVCLAHTVSTGCPDHCVKLEGGGFVPNKNIEVWRTTDGGNWACALDFYNQPTCSGPNAGEMFKIFDQNVRAGSVTMNATASKFSINPVKSATATSQNHVFFGVQVMDVQSNDAAGRAQKLSQFIPRIGKETNCTNIQWDPYGIVFDATTLEPIPGASVTLLNAQKVVVPGSPGITNPQKTGEAVDLKDSKKGWFENGFFNFFVPAGTYYLKPFITGYDFPVDAATFAKLSRTPYVNVYKDSDTKIIEEAGKIVRADIPMIPSKGTRPTNNPPVVKISQLLQYCVGNTCYQMAVGKCSHISCTVTAYSGTRQVDQKKVDNKGGFTMLISAAKIDAGQKLNFQATKIPIVLSSTPSLLSSLFDSIVQIVSPVIYAEDELVGPMTSVDPVPAYIEGYAYDTKGTVLPEGKVQIVIEGMGNRSVLTAQADKSGFVRIPHFFTPPTGYSLVIYDKFDNKVGAIKPSKFIAQNKTYYKTKGVNVLQPTIVDDVVTSTYSAVIGSPKQVPFINSGIGNNSKQETVNSKPGTVNEKQQTAKQNSGSSILFFVLTIVFVVTLGSVGFLILHLRKKEVQVE